MVDIPPVDVAVDCVDDAVTVDELLLSGNLLPGIVVKGAVLFVPSFPKLKEKKKQE